MFRQNNNIVRPILTNQFIYNNQVYISPRENREQLNNNNYTAIFPVSDNRWSGYVVYGANTYLHPDGTLTSTITGGNINIKLYNRVSSVIVKNNNAFIPIMNSNIHNAMYGTSMGITDHIHPNCEYIDVNGNVIEPEFVFTPGCHETVYNQFRNSLIGMRSNLISQTTSYFPTGTCAQVNGIPVVSTALVGNYGEIGNNFIVGNNFNKALIGSNMTMNANYVWKVSIMEGNFSNFAVNKRFNIAGSYLNGLPWNCTNMFRGCTGYVPILNLRHDEGGYDIQQAYDLTGMFADVNKSSAEVSYLKVNYVECADEIFRNAYSYNIDWTSDYVFSMNNAFNGYGPSPVRVNFNIKNIFYAKDAFSHFNGTLNLAPVNNVINAYHAENLFRDTALVNNFTINSCHLESAFRNAIMSSRNIVLAPRESTMYLENAFWNFRVGNLILEGNYNFNANNSYYVDNNMSGGLHIFNGNISGEPAFRRVTQFSAYNTIFNYNLQNPRFYAKGTNYPSFGPYLQQCCITDGTYLTDLFDMGRNFIPSDVLSRAFHNCYIYNNNNSELFYANLVFTNSIGPANDHNYNSYGWRETWQFKNNFTAEFPYWGNKACSLYLVKFKYNNNTTYTVNVILWRS